MLTAIHGDAGTMQPDSVNPGTERAHCAGLHRALMTGHAVLVAGGPAVEAVTVAVAAQAKSRKGTEKRNPDETYSPLPRRNVANTELGFKLYESGRIRAAARP